MAGAVPRQLAQSTVLCDGPLVARDVLSAITEKHVAVAVVVPPRHNPLNGRPEVDVLVLADPSRLMHSRTLKKNFSRVGVFNPAG